MKLWKDRSLVIISMICALGLGVIAHSGCASASTAASNAAYTTFATVGNAVDAAEKGYLDAVVKGIITTNSLATVERDYNTFQRDYGAALALAVGSTNAIAPASLSTEARAFVAEAQTSK